MDLDELRSVQSKERTKDSLQHLRDSFYEDVAAYLAERKRQRDERAAGVDNPFSDEHVRKLSDEIETAEEVVESLYERRVGKVVKLSSFAAAGAPTDTEGMTVQEAELFEDLVVRIEQNKGRVLDVLENGADVDIDAEAAASEVAGSEAPDAEPTASATVENAPADEAPGAAAGDAGGVLADAMGADDGAVTDETAEQSVEGTENDHPTDASASTDAESPADAGTPAEHAPPSDAPTRDPDDPPEEFVPGSEPDRAADGSAGGDGAVASNGDADRRTVRITSDVGQILGVDEREYELASDDVVTLPAANADPLVERDAAEPIE
ncbi:DNA replication complex subunit Gins51 [Halobaculum roseum]|uniref:Gins51 C-terminal domain-containing protein n=1 Tax=Halobaculum roseum TaxID=2175149 RepID=A0ABD5MJ57_9EURY|nr:hypothetical protein [Halobaculum roseum]QZY02946.1 hypothetical protein K6T36_01765 [Halobaculum roseum]